MTGWGKKDYNASDAMRSRRRFIVKKLLSLALALSCAGGLAEALPREADALPNVGDVVNGFEVK